MNIKEIIDKEYWLLDSRDAYSHNASLNRIYTAVIESEMALINQIKLWSADCTTAEKHITDLEKQVGSVNDALSILDLVQVVPLVNGLKERIAELEVQVPKTVTPKCVGKGVLGFKVYRCNCDTSLCPADFYCPNCGSKLNWEDA